MPTAPLKVKTTVLPGKRIEFTAPELVEGEGVEVVVTPPETTNGADAAPRRFKDVMEFLDSLPPVERTPEQWAEVEREFQAERDSWDR